MPLLGDLEMTTDNGDHEVFVPFLSDSEGRFLSYDLKSSSRHARSLNGDRNLYVSFKAFKSDFLLRLEPNDKLIAPKATVEWQEGNTTRKERIKDRCFYRGHLNNASVSSVAVTNCRGLSNMVVPGNPSRSLEQVCRWAHDVQTEDLDDSDHHDHAIFLTRIDFGPAGYAPVTGMCHELRSCTLNHEDGFSSAFVVAHETGHVLGMEHDGDGNDCSDETAYGSIMAPLVQATFSRYHWSRCSQMELRQHISDYYCLDDDPFEKDWPKIPEYPGINYSMDEQCTFDFGGGYRLCTAFKTYDPCKQLWCSHPGNPFFCKTKKGPALDGTSCGDRLWCLQGSCQKEHPIAIHGGWSTWTAWEECSRTCDIGIRVRHRTCDNPRPERGGSDCKGQSQEFELCNTQDCPDSPVDFRAQQCSVHDIEEILGTTHHWIPHQPEGEKSPCKLQCISREKGDIHRFPGDVIDGTRCSYDNPTNICALGKCETVGCDRKLQSTKEFDNCGVCGGDSTKCKTIKGTFDKAPRPGNTIPGSDEESDTEYQEVVVLPKGAWNIEVFETTPSPHFIALKNAVTGVVALKDHGTKEALLHFVEGGARWTYLRSSDSETLGTKGPLLQPIVVLISPKGVEPSTLAYKYVIHEDLLPSVNNNMIPGGSPDEYIWVMRAWTVCSKSCGGGVQYTRYACKRKSDDKVMNIRLCNKDERPAVLRRECNIHSCQEARMPSTKPHLSQVLKTIHTQTHLSLVLNTIHTQTHLSLVLNTIHTQTHLSLVLNTIHTHTHLSLVLNTIHTQTHLSLVLNTIHTQTHLYLELNTIHTQTHLSLERNTIHTLTHLSLVLNTIHIQTHLSLVLNTIHIPSTHKHTCPWWVEEAWEHCSKTCGMEGYQIRTVRCVRPTPDNSSIEPVHHKHCKEDKPANRQPCNRVPCPSFWRTGAWSKDTCAGDQSIFCQLDVLSRYCSIPGYQKLCCRSCRRYQPTPQLTQAPLNQTVQEGRCCRPNI
ncbi:A disintegrin and metalloproteinase with thrombospondin motifs 14 [Branchiostoma belcheri]|nr:A disintegrin and metalloproteinase with thrombospondin motifs 14 [Branchiostoma belcheri]